MRDHTLIVAFPFFGHAPWKTIGCIAAATFVLSFETGKKHDPVTQPSLSDFVVFCDVLPHVRGQFALCPSQPRDPLFRCGAAQTSFHIFCSTQGA